MLPRADGEQRPGLLIVLSGPSGVGKDAAIAALKARDVGVRYAVTATTRPRRPGEINGVHYYFYSREEFEAMVARHEFLEWSWVHGHMYGPPIAVVRGLLQEGHDVLLKIDVQGAANVKKRVKDAIFIFLAPPSIEDLVERMQKRHTESAEEVEVRIANAYKEMAALPEYDYIVVNEDGRLDKAVDEIQAIITAERLRVYPRRAEII
ncbi:MAG TPA: guanylate kinase [Chloroflexota bacterium]|nr:guanylate kinase [Chloroflexota bacterium]